MPQALYRTYRPKRFADIVGQESVVQVLQNAARTEKIGHAYLFYGSRGSGKTTIARLLAKVANCETRANNKAFKKEGEPCNRCKPCQEIDAGHALDVVEIDAASNRGIDEIRSLRESIALSPASYRTKVFIIDEAHQLTKEAFNALLKTLEEPPLHAVFVLATTEFEKVPATIASRTQRFHFRKLTIPEITEKLERIAKAEHIAATPDALELIAAAAEGSIRDAESLLEQVASFEETVSLAGVEKLIGAVGFERTEKLADLMLTRNLAGSLEYLAEVGAGGYNVVELTRELIHYLRRAVTLKANPELAKLFANELPEKELVRLKDMSNRIVLEKDIPLLRSLIESYSQMRYSPFAAIPLELTLIEHLSPNKASNT